MKKKRESRKKVKKAKYKGRKKTISQVKSEWWKMVLMALIMGLNLKSGRSVPCFNWIFWMMLISSTETKEAISGLRKLAGLSFFVCFPAIGTFQHSFITDTLLSLPD